jgi:hypothetical protein
LEGQDIDKVFLKKNEEKKRKKGRNTSRLLMGDKSLQGGGNSSIGGRQGAPGTRLKPAQIFQKLQWVSWWQAYVKKNLLYACWDGWVLVSYYFKTAPPFGLNVFVC